MFSLNIASQTILFPQEYFFEQYKNQKNYTTFSSDTCYHTSLFPVINNNTLSYDSLNYYKTGRNWLSRKLLQDHFIDLKVDDTTANEINQFHLELNPLLNLNVGQVHEKNSNDKIYTNTRGIVAKLQFNKRLTLETAFIENQSFFPSYVQKELIATKDALGQGRWKEFKKTGYDYAMSSGVIWWGISKNVQVYFGHGKQKVGNGYRSMFLSDISHNYPYARIDLTSYKLKLKYTATYALLMNLTPTLNLHTPQGTEILLQKKPYSFQYISYSPSKHISIGLFQGVVWKPSNERSIMDVSPNFLNPLIFTNLGVYGFNSTPEIVAGVESNIRLTKDIQFYFQLATDGKKDSLKKAQSYGLQIGLKLFDAFTIKNLFLQVEYNEYKNNFYRNVTLASSPSLYSHYGQNLAYRTSGVSGQEAIAMAAYKYKRFMFTVKANYFPDITLEKSTTFSDGKISFVLQPKTNMNIALGCVLRNVQNKNNSLLNNQISYNNASYTQWIYLSFTTSLYNIYFDF